MSRTGRLPSRLMGMEQCDTNREFVEETLRVWQPRAGGWLTEDDAREIVTNMAGFFRTLLEWDRDARREGAFGETSDATGGGG